VIVHVLEEIRVADELREERQRKGRVEVISRSI
jgi:hypothetical protein